MGSAVRAIANPKRAFETPGDTLAGIGSDMFDPANIVHKSPDDSGPAPEAPGVDPSLAKLKEQQLANAKNFRANIPSMQKQMGENLQTSANQELSGQLKGTQEANSRRGLLYSSINKGQQAGERARTQAGIARETGNINTGLLNAANTLDTQAIQTGVGIQQTQ